MSSSWILVIESPLFYSLLFYNYIILYFYSLRLIIKLFITYVRVFCLCCRRVHNSLLSSFLKCRTSTSVEGNHVEIVWAPTSRSRKGDLVFRVGFPHHGDGLQGEGPWLTLDYWWILLSDTVDPRTYLLLGSKSRVSYLFSSSQF